MSAYFSIALTTEKKTFTFILKLNAMIGFWGFFFVVNIEIE